MTLRKRIGTLLLCFGLILTLAVSTALIVHEADHDCCGEDCPICEMIAARMMLLRTLGWAGLLLLSAFFLLPVGRAFFRRARFARCFHETLVSWKIRLND